MKEQILKIAKDLEEGTITTEQSQTLLLGLFGVSGSIFLILKGWVDPMENRNADGYEEVGYVTTIDEAKEICDNGGCFTADDCWSVKYRGGSMPKFIYKEIPYYH